MPEAHARLSPSGACKWMLCPASLAAERGITETTSEHAAEGTAAHAVAEKVLKAVNPLWRNKRPTFSRLAAKDYVGENVEGWIITEDMAPDIQVYIDTVLIEAQGKTLHVEQRVDFSHVVDVPDSFGTADAIIISPGELQIHDLKFGRGVRVDAKNNYQLMIYALGAIPLFELAQDINTIKLFIHQPRLNHLSEWTLSLKELQKFGREVKKAAKKAISLYKKAEKNAVIDSCFYNPGEKQCRWCKRAGNCKAQTAFVYEQVANEFVDLDAAEFDPVNPAAMTPEQQAAAHQNIDFIEAWCERVRKWVYAQMLSGGDVPGLKLVKGKPGNRKWLDEQDAESLLLNLTPANDDVYTRKLITPTQAERVFKHDDESWQRLQPLIARADGAPVVVSASDPRPALLSVIDEFE